MKRGVTVFLLFMCCSLSVLWAQQIQFAETVHDFGTVDQNSEPLIHEFKFVNTGKTPLVIYRVTTSCGCTTPNWTTEPIAPGKSGSVKVAFDPSGQKGRITKNIMVNSNADDDFVTLYVKGMVAIDRSAEHGYKETEGDLLLKTKSLLFGKLKATEKKTLAIELYNRGDSPMEIRVEQIEKYIKVLVNPSLLMPKKRGMIFVTIIGEKMEEGRAFHSLFLLKTKNSSNEKSISITVDGSI